MRQWVLGAAAMAAVVCAVGLPTQAQAQNAGEVIVSIDGLIFEAPDDRSRVILRVQAGERFKTLGTQGDWVKVQLPRGTGWIMSRIVRAEGDSPPLAGIGGQGGEQVTVVDEFADVKAGPGDAYLGVRRVFRGDSFQVARRSDDGEWVQIRIDGDMGWVRADQIMAADAVGGGGDPVGGGGGGGEVVGGGGDPIGGGGGQITDPEIGGELGGDGAEGAVEFELRVSGNLQFASQQFNSDSPGNQFLQLYNVDSMLAGPEVHARAWIFDYAGAVVDYQLGLGAPIEAQLIPGQAPVELSNTTHRLQAGVTGRFPFTEGPRSTWAGVTAGMALHQFDIQTVQQSPELPPVFLVNTYLGARLAVEFGAAFGPIDLWGSGGLILGSVDQGQFDSGKGQSLTAFGAEVGAGFQLGGGFGAFLKGTFDKYTTDFTGDATRQDDISVARNTDQFISVSTGLSWRP